MPHAPTIYLILKGEPLCVGNGFLRVTMKYRIRAIPRMQNYEYIVERWDEKSNSWSTIASFLFLSHANAFLDQVKSQTETRQDISYPEGLVREIEVS